MAILNKYGKVMTEHDLLEELLLLAATRRNLRIAEAKFYSFLKFKELEDDFDRFTDSLEDLEDTILCFGSDEDVELSYEIEDDEDVESGYFDLPISDTEDEDEDDEYDDAYNDFLRDEELEHQPRTILSPSVQNLYNENMEAFTIKDEYYRNGDKNGNV